MVPNWGRSKSRLYTVTCYFSLYAEYVMQNAKPDEIQAGIKISGRDYNNLRYADNMTLMAKKKKKKK